MRPEDAELYEAMAAAARAGRPCALATVVATLGSTPRKVGTKMLVEPARGLVGTVGGGCGEAEVIEAAEAALLDGRPRRLRVDLARNPASWSPAVCGGIMDVLVEAVEPFAPSVPGHDSG